MNVVDNHNGMLSEDLASDPRLVPHREAVDRESPWAPAHGPLSAPLPATGPPFLSEGSANEAHVAPAKGRPNCGHTNPKTGQWLLRLNSRCLRIPWSVNDLSITKVAH